MIRFATVALLAVLLAGCSSTRLEHGWKDPEVKTLSFAKLMVVAPYPDGAVRREAEDSMRAAITAVPVVTSYQSVKDPDALRDVNQVLAAAKQAGADGVVTMRLVSDRTELEYSPGAAYPAGYYAMPGYWGPRYGLAPMAYAPPTVTSARMVGIETSIYRVSDHKLLWSGLSSTRNPSEVKVLITETVEVVRERLVKDGLIAKP